MVNVGDDVPYPHQFQPRSTRLIVAMWTAARIAGVSGDGNGGDCIIVEPGPGADRVDVLLAVNLAERRDCGQAASGGPGCFQRSDGAASPIHSCLLLKDEVLRFRKLSGGTSRRAGKTGPYTDRNAYIAAWMGSARYRRGTNGT